MQNSFSRLQIKLLLAIFRPFLMSKCNGTPSQYSVNDAIFQNNNTHFIAMILNTDAEKKMTKRLKIGPTKINKISFSKYVKRGKLMSKRSEKSTFMVIFVHLIIFFSKCEKNTEETKEIFPQKLQKSGAGKKLK